MKLLRQYRRLRIKQLNKKERQAQYRTAGAPVTSHN